jgi:hypothetical protein
MPRGKKGGQIYFPGQQVQAFVTTPRIDTRIPMPRMGRAVLPDYSHHIIQRGHNRQAAFAETNQVNKSVPFSQDEGANQQKKHR